MPKNKERMIAVDNNVVLTEMTKKIRLKGYSQKTLKAYVGHVRRLADYFECNVDELNSVQLEEYLLTLVQDAGHTASYVNQAASAYKFLYKEVLGSQGVVVDLPRMKIEKRLPVVLTKKEVASIIGGVKNLKHKAILVVTYSAGLRVGEAVSLTVKDIDSQRMLIHVRQGKGKKDRYTLLSVKALAVLRDYARLYKPKEWLFEGVESGRHVTERSAQKVFEVACRRSGITKDVSIHDLRHAFCTHLLENGTDIRYIQELVGHSSPKTTQLYLHVSTKHLGNIESPLDRMIRRENPRGCD
jgi:integrase/recombinase XerD